jgi:hypothetical protein
MAIWHCSPPTCSQNDVQATYLIYCNCFGAISFLMTLSCGDSLSCGARRVCILRESVIYILRDATVSPQEKQPDYPSSILRRYDQITSLSCGMADFGSLSCGRINVHPDRHKRARPGRAPEAKGSPRGRGSGSMMGI